VSSRRQAPAIHAALVGALLLVGCAAPSAPATLDPLFRAPSSEGRIEVDPTRTGRTERGPVRAADPRIEVPGQPCRHTFGPHGTHTYIDPLTGLPALCAVVRCTKCGEIRHECGLGRR
jgi:hypothetical protein